MEYIITKVEAKSARDIIKKAEAMGFEIEKETINGQAYVKKYVCSLCKERFTAFQAKGVDAGKATINKTLIGRASKNAMVFIEKATGIKRSVCPCGMRKVPKKEDAKTITEDTVPTNPVTAAAKGMVKAARAAKKRAPKKKAEQQVLPVVGDETDC